MNIHYKNFLVPQIQNTVIVIIVAVAVWFGSPFDNEPSAAASISPLTNYLLGLLQNYAWLSRVLSFVLALLSAFLLVQLNNQYGIVRIQTFLPALFYVMTVGFLDNQSNLFNGGNIATLFVLLALFEFLSINSERETGKVFNVFLSLSLAGLFVFQTILLVPFFWFAFAIIFLPSLRMFLASFIGLIVPYLFAVPLYLYFSETPDIHFLVQEKISSFDLYQCNWFEGIFLLILGSVLFISFVSFVLSAQRESVRTRKINYAFYILMLGSTAITLLSGEHFAELLPVTALSFSVLASHYFSFNYNWFSKTLMCLFVFAGATLFVSQFI